MALSEDRLKKIIFWFWLTFGTGLFLVILLFICISFGWIGRMPSFEELENPNSNLTTEIISSDRVILGGIFKENRSFVEYDQISPNVIKALVATEDVRFYSHSGIDTRGLMRVGVRTVLMGDKSSGGGSTITQQLAKLLFHEPASNLFERSIQKLNEWVIAIKLERSYTKEEILMMYLNKAPFIYDAYGIQSAAKTFFNTSADSLQVEEAAVLIGMLKNPSLFNPIRRNEITRERRNVVLFQMKKAKYITQAEYDSLSAMPLQLHFARADHKEGSAPYLREYVRLTMSANKPERKHYPSYSQQKFVEDSIEWANNPFYGWINKNLKPDGTKYNLYSDGLKIFTTVDSRMQIFAEEAVNEHLGKEIQPQFFKAKKGKSRAPFSFRISSEQMEGIMNRAVRQSERYILQKKAGRKHDEIISDFYNKVPMTVFSWKGDKDTIMSPMDSIKYYKFFLRASLLSMDPLTGQVKAYVGGPNFKHFMYDMATQGKRQVGSTIKPFVYALAMQEGHTPCDMVPNIPQTFILPTGLTWSPRNSGDDRDGEMVSLKWGLANSNNNITAWVMKQYNPEAVVKMIHQIGIKSPMDAVPSLCLGTPDLTLCEMVGGYCTFANKGVHTEPYFCTHIEDRFGNTLATFTPQKKEAMSENTAYMMLDLLQAVINQGTGMRIRGEKYRITAQMGGKTGTTQNHSDGWFIGVTPNLVTGVWVGGEDRDIHFDNLSTGQGANLALPIYALYLNKIYAHPSINITQEDLFEQPENYIQYNCNDSKDASPVYKETNEDDFF